MREDPHWATSRMLGAVLAGGMSRRLGRDKANETVDELRLIERAVEALAAVSVSVVVVSSRPETPTGEWEIVPDARDGCGPLAGIETALELASERGFEGVFVLACDLPLVDGELVSAIANAVGGARACAASRDGDPDFEPLCAVYATSCLPIARSLLDSGARAARALFEGVDGRAVEVCPEAMLNVNTQGELERARSVLAARRQ